MGFYLEHGVIIDVKGGYFIMHDTKYPLVTPKSNIPLYSEAVAHVSYNIPAKSESVLLARISTPNQSLALNGFCGVLEPVHLKNADCIVARTVSNVEDGFTNVCVINPNDFDVPIHANMLLGHFHAISSDGNTYQILESDNKGQVNRTNDIVRGESNVSCIHPPVEFDESGLSRDEVEKVKQLLCSYSDSDIFNDTPGRTRLVKHTIRTVEGVSPIRQRAYRT